ncbi:CDP-alcohol phosphatidyltransferase family protein [Bacteroidia bacterium]|nr:CDP-alcohol phosphatidyltransferase family protein [Bacteroidia bacterium]MDB9881529.1 CDP-alcohol phosphatidyltransferase family protein [Bacteroidia bacterium]MDC1395303.1 CDP-alcohol phosphatidyltransferase family protein [Bacteroidia bacterium]
MSKLPKEYQFVDLSDYGRFVARRIAGSLKNTSVTPIQVTYWFIISGLLAIVCIFYELNIAAAFFLILKSILDAADGELSRLKKIPSYVGRYFDSIADIVLNFLFLLTFWYVTEISALFFLFAFIGLQLQGTLFNYYYVILRNSVDGDTTSRIFEDKVPTAMKGEDQHTVNKYFKVFNVLYRPFDKIIHAIDKDAVNSKPFPKWFMTSVSSMGLGFQLLIMSIMLLLNLEEFIITFFLFYSAQILLLVGIRRFVLK